MEGRCGGHAPLSQNFADVLDLKVTARSIATGNVRSMHNSMFNHFRVHSKDYGCRWERAVPHVTFIFFKSIVYADTVEV